MGKSCWRASLAKLLAQCIVLHCPWTAHKLSRGAGGTFISTCPQLNNTYPDWTIDFLQVCKLVASKKCFFKNAVSWLLIIHWLPFPSPTLSFVPCCVLDVLFASVLLLFWGRLLTKETSTISNFLQEELRFVFCPNPLREKNPSLQSNRTVYVLNDLPLISAVCLEVSNVKRHLDRRFQSWLTWVPPAVMGTYFLKL